MEEKVSKKASIRVRDKMEAAFLWCQDFIEFVGVSVKQNSSNSKAVYFEFEVNSSESVLSALRNDYYNSKSLVEPKTFLMKLEDTSNLLHEALRNSNKENK